MTRPTPGLLVAAPRSGSGKTTVTLGLQRALARRGLIVGAAKCGPDYIDPAFHAAATGRASLNLDSFAMPPALLGAMIARAGAGADLVVAEGSMGLFDGVRAGEGRTGASADVAARAGWPVLLVVDASGAAQSAGAVALGLARFDGRVRVGGVVLNKLASVRHERLAREGVARAGLPLLGALPREAALTLPERHLGLVQAGETADLSARLDALAALAERHLDLDGIVALAAGGLEPCEAAPALLAPGRAIALADDAAFSFTYPHVLAGWAAAGAELRRFSPLRDEPPPEACDACWLPGGYPELHAGTLAGAARFMAGLRAFAATRPVHGECGGYMVLGRSLTDADGVAHPMADLLPVATSYAARRLHLGYRVATLRADGPLGPAGGRLIGHEFHYAIVTDGAPPDFAEVTDAEGNVLGLAGHRRGRVSGTWFHAVAGEVLGEEAA